MSGVRDLFVHLSQWLTPDAGALTSSIGGFLLEIEMEKRPIRIEGDVGYVLLACGAEAIIDAEDAELVGKHNWSLSCGYVRTNLWLGKGQQRTLRLHRLVMGDPEGKAVDHRKGDPLDNRKGLLREATGSQNSMNAKRSCANTSGHKGVFWSKANKKWRALIRHEGKQTHLGLFTDIEAAAQAYREAAIRLYGEFANFG
jgi:hypothetical protein